MVRALGVLSLSMIVWGGLASVTAQADPFPGSGGAYVSCYAPGTSGLAGDLEYSFLAIRTELLERDIPSALNQMRALDQAIRYRLNSGYRIPAPSYYGDPQGCFGYNRTGLLSVFEDTYLRIRNELLNGDYVEALQFLAQLSLQVRQAGVTRPEPVPSYPIPSYPTPSYPSPDYPAPAYPTPSYPAPYYPTPSYPAPYDPRPSYPGSHYPGPSYPGSHYPGPSYPGRGDCDDGRWGRGDRDDGRWGRGDRDDGRWGRGDRDDGRWGRGDRDDGRWGHGDHDDGRSGHGDRDDDRWRRGGHH